MEISVKQMMAIENKGHDMGFTIIVHNVLEYFANVLYASVELTCVLFIKILF